MENNNLNNTNEVENNVDINNQSNNLEQNNKNKNDNSIKPVIIMFIVLLLFVFVFLGNDNNLFSSNNDHESGLIDNTEKEEDIDNNKDNVQDENNDNNVENNENEYTELEKNILDEYYLKTTDIIDVHVLKYKYSTIANNEISYTDFRKNYVVKNIIDNNKPISNVGCGNETTVSHIKDEYDKDGVKYPDYCGDYGNSCVENIAKDFGLTVEEISKMDKSVWSTTGGQYCFYMYDAKEVKDKYFDIYNNIFNSSFSLHLNNEIYGAGYIYSYDKNLDKIITASYSGIAGAYKREIIDSVKDDNLYKVKFVEGFFEPDFNEKGKHVLAIDSKTRINSIENQSKALKENKDKLPNYEVVFEKVDNGYKYKSIKKIEKNKVNYEIRSEVDSSTGDKWYYLYLNNKKVNDIKAYDELGKIEVKEFNDLLIVDEQNPGPSRRLLVVDKNGNTCEIDYKVSTYNQEFINHIDSYKIDGNNLYIKVNRQWGTGYIDWYCLYEDKNEVAEYEVKHEYVNGKLENKQVLNEVTIVTKYANEKCN